MHKQDHDVPRGVHNSFPMIGLQLFLGQHTDICFILLMEAGYFAWWIKLDILNFPLLFQAGK